MELRQREGAKESANFFVKRLDPFEVPSVQMQAVTFYARESESLQMGVPQEPINHANLLKNYLLPPVDRHRISRLIDVVHEPSHCTNKRDKS